jgi:N-glycosylase/DNA lyase
MTPPRAAGLLDAYRKIKPDIKKRLSEFRSIHKADEERVFSELCFCILTANANALMCDKAISELKDTGLLMRGSACQIKPKLRGRVRFHNKKADFIVRARDLFKQGGRLSVKERLDLKDIIATREWLVENIKGYGYKEASHFLRNIGLGRDIAILDRHILKNLNKYKVIGKVPDSVGSRKIYLTIEEKMRVFSRRIGIPMEDLDLLFWSLQTGFIFK